MEIGEAFKAFDDYFLWFVILGLSFFATSVLPRIFSSYPFSTPILLLALGYVVIKLPLGLDAPDPMEHGDITEHLTELVVIISLMGAGLKLDRPPSLKGWSSTWRLLSITMILSIGLTALVGFWIAAFVPATALLLGAVMAPTDPVLASEVQVGAPGEGTEDKESEEIDIADFEEEEDEVRFSLTSEAGLNDGLAFPFTNMAIAMAIAGNNPQNWIKSWLLIHVFYELGVGVIIGLGLGYLVAMIIVRLPAETNLDKAIVGISAVAATLIIYGTTEYVGGYGFVATFLGSAMIKNYDRSHEYQKRLHIFNENIERILMAVVLIAFGAAIAGSLFEPMSWPLIISALVIVFIVRPLSGIIGLIGFKKAPWREKIAISFFGIKGIGSLYYLSYAFNQASFPGDKELWALVSLVIVISIFVHGITATPVTDKLDKLREQNI